MKKTFVVIACSLQVLAVLAANGSAQNSAPSAITTTQQEKRAAFDKKFKDAERQRNWRVAGWTEDNEPFAKIRREIDYSLRNGGSAHQLAKKYELTGQDRYSALKQFRWAYAAYRSQYAAPDEKTMIRIAEVMDTNLRPGAYDWERLRFLVEADRIVFNDSAEMIELGRRLVKRNPADREVRYPFARVLSFSRSDDYKDCLEALAMARTEVHRNTKSVRWQALLAGTLSRMWTRTKKPEYARSARDAYRKCLTLLRPKHPYRKNMIRGAVWFENYCNPDGTRRKGATHQQYVQALKLAYARDQSSSRWLAKS